MILRPLPTAARPDPATARDWLGEELARAPYQRSLVQRVGDWFAELLSSLRDLPSGSNGWGTLVAVVVMVALAAGLAFLLSRLRTNASADVDRSGVFTESREASGVHRRRAGDALAADRFEEAVVESVRAITSGLFERGMLSEHTDVTVHEVTEQAAALFAGHGERLRAVGRAFEDTRYGDRAATRTQAEQAVALDRDLLGLSPDRSGVSGPVTAVPR